MIPKGHRIERVAGIFTDIIPSPDIEWAYGHSPSFAIYPDARDTHLLYRDEMGMLLGVLTYQAEGACELKWIKSQRQGIGSHLLAHFVSSMADWIISCTVIAEGGNKEKLEHLLRKHGFLNVSDNDWER